MKIQNAPGVLGGLAAGLFLGAVLWAQAKPPVSAPLTAAEIKDEKTQTEMVNKILERIKTVKPGQTRADLLKVFKTEGGLSTSVWQTYVYRTCLFIKVDVDFRNVGKATPVPNSGGAVYTEREGGDIILKISKPYIEWTVLE